MENNKALTDKSVKYICIGGTISVAITVAAIAYIAHENPKLLKEITDKVASTIRELKHANYEQLPSAA